MKDLHCREFPWEISGAYTRMWLRCTP